MSPTQAGGVYLISDGRTAWTHHAGVSRAAGTDPAQSGHGLMLEVLSDTTLAAMWYTFAPDGGTGLVRRGVGTIQGNQAVVTANPDARRQVHPEFRSDRDREAVLGHAQR